MMFMLMTYDVEANRTSRFRKILRRYLNHEQYSVFTGDITEAEAIRFLLIKAAIFILIPLAAAGLAVMFLMPK